jgi:peptide/nickel transport system ATP-binding protein
MTVPLLDAKDLVRSYPWHVGRGTHPVTAVDGVSLRLDHGSCHGVVGESGSGKSTLCRLLLALERPDAGTVRFDGHLISHMSQAAVRPLRRRFQPVFQDPLGSLNPRLRVSTLVAEPLAAHRIGTASERRDRVRELLDRVGLPSNSAGRYPGAFSGGERQRIAIARALAPEPELLLLDEPVSSLDASIRTEILELLHDLSDRLKLTLLLVSHDLDTVRLLADHVSVMYLGSVLEEGPTVTVLSRPAHPYTRALVEAVPRLEPGWHPPPPPITDQRQWLPGSCRYAPRCPLATEQCTQEPGLEAIADHHLVACWHAEKGN